MYRTEDELRAAIVRLRTDTALRERLGREGRVAYEAEFAEAPFLRHYLAVVYEMLAKKRRGQPIEMPSLTAASQLLAGRPVLFAREV
jgi:hypothetical protein